MDNKIVYQKILLMKPCWWTYLTFLIKMFCLQSLFNYYIYHVSAWFVVNHSSKPGVSTVFSDLWKNSTVVHLTHLKSLMEIFWIHDLRKILVSVSATTFFSFFLLNGEHLEPSIPLVSAVRMCPCFVPNIGQKVLLTFLASFASLLKISPSVYQEKDPIKVYFDPCYILKCFFKLFYPLAIDIFPPASFISCCFFPVMCVLTRMAFDHCNRLFSQDSFIWL